MPTLSESLISRGIASPLASSPLPIWRKAKSALLAGGTLNVRLAFVGDSKLRGWGAGTAASNGALTNGAAPKSKPARVAQLLAAAGVPTIADSIFGTGGAVSMADAVAYDPRLSGFSGWSGGNVSLGGSAFYTAGTNPGTFTPSRAVDRASVFYRQKAGEATFTVTKGAESTPINSGSGADAITRADLTFNTKDASAISMTRTGGGSLNIVGLIAWDSAAPGVEIANFAVSGVTSGYQADVTSPWSPANALAAYAPHLTIIALGTNDLIQNVPMATWLANITTIMMKAKASGDVILTWPAIAGADGSGGLDSIRATWREALRSLASANGCVFVDEEALFGGRAGAVAQSWFAEPLHESAAAYYAEAVPLSRMLAVA